ncbi:uncharacterized protein [Diadema setosum]|uniref:uncharacterized protein n=1 Tax=Diadema setosum TaxID=31175 RepID=UPI003B3AA4A0
MDTDDPSQVPDTLTKLKHFICSSCTKCHSVEVVGKAVELGIVPKLVSLLKNEDTSKVPWEACWMLVNITFYESDQCETLMNLDILPSLVKLASSSDQKAQEGAFDLLRNLAGSCAEMRDKVLDSGVSDVLLR